MIPPINRPPHNKSIQKLASSFSRQTDHVIIVHSDLEAIFFLASLIDQSVDRLAKKIVATISMCCPVQKKKVVAFYVHQFGNDHLHKWWLDGSNTDQMALLSINLAIPEPPNLPGCCLHDCVGQCSVHFVSGRHQHLLIYATTLRQVSRAIFHSPTKRGDHKLIEREIESATPPL
jgi:hypothetical protein